MNFSINKLHASEAFRVYTANYDTENINVAVKISHTYRVAGIAERIAGSIPDVDIGFAWLLGLLHDIGRFEQITRYGTFKDALSVDHAELGADILFRDNLFFMFVQQEEIASEDFHRMKVIAENAIRQHNKLRLPDNMEEQSRLYAKILRDADKVDIFRVLTEPPYNEGSGKLRYLTARDEVMQCVNEHRCVPRAKYSGQANELEVLISQCCMAFELEFEESRNITVRQGYLKKLLNKDSSQLKFLRDEIIKSWGIKEF